MVSQVMPRYNRRTSGNDPHPTGREGIWWRRYSLNDDGARRRRASLVSRRSCRSGGQIGRPKCWVKDLRFVVDAIGLGPRMTAERDRGEMVDSMSEGVAVMLMR